VQQELQDPFAGKHVAENTLWRVQGQDVVLRLLQDPFDENHVAENTLWRILEQEAQATNSLELLQYKTLCQLQDPKLREH
jgi:hypothetical protein